jgi:hypothetical protein
MAGLVALAGAGMGMLYGVASGAVCGAIGALTKPRRGAVAGLAVGSLTAGCGVLLLSQGLLVGFLMGLLVAVAGAIGGYHGGRVVLGV